MQRARIISALSASLAAEAVNRLVPLVILHVVVQRIGLAAFGLSDFSYRLINYGITFTVFGYAGIAAIEVGECRDNARQVATVIGEVLALKAINAIIALSALFAILSTVQGYAQYQPFVTALSFILASSVIDLTFVHLGTSRMLPLVFLTSATKLASLACVLIFVQGPADAILYSVLNFGANSVIALANFTINVRRYGIAMPSRGALLLRFRRCLPYALTVILMVLLDSFDVFIVERHFGKQGVGLYSGAGRLVIALMQVVGTIGAVFIGELVATRSREEFTRHVNAGLWSMYALVAPVCVASFFLGSSILSLVVGPEFADQAGVFSILTCTLMAQGLVSVYGMQVLLSKRRGSHINIILFCATALGVVLAIPLTTAFGLSGAAWATLLSRSAAGIAFAAYARAYVDRLPLKEAATTWLPAVGMGVVLYLVRPATLGPALVLSIFAYSALFILSNRKRLTGIVGEYLARRQI